jgi:hypothetical protein
MSNKFDIHKVKFPAAKISRIYIDPTSPPHCQLVVIQFDDGVEYSTNRIYDSEGFYMVTNNNVDIFKAITEMVNNLLENLYAEKNL